MGQLHSTSEQLNSCQMEQLCELFEEILKEIRLNGLVSNIAEQFRKTIQTIKNLSDVKTTIPAPPPPPILIGKKMPLAPPPPTIAIGKKTPNGPIKIVKNCDVPLALKPKVFPPEGQKMRHLQWTKIPLHVLKNSTNSTSIVQENTKLENVWQKMEAVDKVLSGSFIKLLIQIEIW